MTASAFSPSPFLSLAPSVTQKMGINAVRIVTNYLLGGTGRTTPQASVFRSRAFVNKTGPKRPTSTAPFRDATASLSPTSTHQHRHSHVSRRHPPLASRTVP